MSPHDVDKTERRMVGHQMTAAPLAELGSLMSVFLKRQDARRPS